MLPNLVSKCEQCALYIQSIFTPLVFHPQDLKVTFTVGDFIHFIIKGNERDDGILIGRQGQTIQAIRLLVHAYSKSHLEGHPCIIEVKDHRGGRFNPLVSRPIIMS